MHYFFVISQNPKAKHKRVSKKKGCTAQIVIKEVYKFPLLKVSTMLSVYIIIHVCGGGGGQLCVQSDDEKFRYSLVKYSVNCSSYFLSNHAKKS